MGGSKALRILTNGSWSWNADSRGAPFVTYTPINSVLMPKYLTGLITTDYWRFPPFPYKSRSWSLDVVETVRSCECCEHPFVAEGRSGERFTGREVLIEARNEIVARKAAFLIQAASDVLDGSSTLSQLSGPLELWDLKKAHTSGREHQDQSRAIRCTQNIPRDCLCAIKITRRRALTYALSKVWLSYQMFSITGIDLDPAHSATLPKSPYPFDHVAYAQAIVLAYAAIEELGLEIRASAKRPSYIDGKWNPEVRDELVERLKSAGINLDEKYSWGVRGPKTFLERQRPPRLISRTPWTQWNIRDGYMEVVDAIAHVSWLRSKVSAHRSKYEFMRALSVYDVANSQYLARRLLLERCGFWRAGTGL